MISETLPTEAPTNRFIRAKNLMLAMVSFHIGYFLIAVSGAAVFAVATVLSSYGVKMLIDDVILPSFDGGNVNFATWASVSTVVVIIGLVRAAGVVVRRTYAGKANSSTAKTIADDALSHLMRQPPSWHRSRMTGDIAARAGVDTDAAAAILGPMPFASSVIVLLTVSGVWLVMTDVWLGLFAFLVFPVMLATNILYQRKVDYHYQVAQDELGALSEAAHESFDGVLVVKAFGAEERETERLAVISRRLRKARTNAITLRSTFESVIDAAPSLVNVAIIAFGAMRVRDGAMTVGELSAFVFLFTLVSLPLRIVSYLFSELPHSASGWARVKQVLDEPLQTSPRDLISHTDEAMVQLRGVSASHVDDVLALRNITLTVPRGRTVAIVGSTGSGKTTLLHLIAGLVAARTGTVGLGTKRVGLVFQEAFLFAESLRYNLTLGADVPQSRIASALRTAAADGFVNELGIGLDTELGERGVSLSGGQRQRLALARALAVGSELLLLDDTTSALDPATEAQVLTNLRSLGADITTLVVASRPSTIALADEVVFMVDGAVAAAGPHDRLLHENLDYRTLISAFEHDRQLPQTPQAPQTSQVRST
jgi:ABC-type multidrug transport system fused ATPase/permease subunit